MTNDNKITYHAFTELVARRAKVSRVEADTYLHQLASSMGEALENGSDIHLYRFGRFHTTLISEQLGTDPNTGAPLTIPEHTRVHFRPYSALRFAVNGPFRKLRIKELTEDKTAWRNRTGILILLAILAMLLILFGIGVMSRIFTQDAPVEPPAQAARSVEPLARPVNEALVTGAPASTITTTAPTEGQTVTPAIASAEPPSPIAQVTATVMTVFSGDTLWTIAATTWGDSFWWPVIYAENRPELSRHNPDLIETGITLRIPVLAGSVNSPRAADLQLKTKAYRIVADDYQKQGNPRAAEYAKVAARGFSK